MQDQTFDLAIAGGGITGACIARDAALRGLKVAIIERRDWSGGTSAASSKLVHGGLRYLKTLEFGLIRESLAERRIWERIAPHMVMPLPFLIPLHKAGFAERLTLSAGLTLYDLLSFDKAWLDDPDLRLSNHRVLSRAEAIAAEPILESPTLKGAIQYDDCQMRAPERLGLECVIDAVENGAEAANYAEAVGFLNKGQGIEGLRARDTLSGETFEIRARQTINATGPWADHVLGLAQNGKPTRHILRSKGIHLIVRALTARHALTIAHKGGHFFILPWRGHTILGTTDTEFKENPDQVAVSEADIAAFLGFVNEGFGNAKLARADVLHAYAGLRPLVDDGASSSYNASRKSELADHEAEGFPGLISAIGGKWTTSRRVAESAVDLVQKKLGQKRRDPQTAVRPLPGGATGRIKAFRSQAEALHKSAQPALTQHLIDIYGARYDRILAKGAAPGATHEPLSNRHPDIGAEVTYAVRHEMALTLEDVVFRRTGLGTLGHPGTSALHATAQIMARELNWSPDETQQAVTRVSKAFLSEAGA